LRVGNLNKLRKKSEAISEVVADAFARLNQDALEPLLSASGSHVAAWEVACPRCGVSM
jgi:hypothetical protein